MCPYPFGSELPLCTSNESSVSEPQLCVSSSAVVRDSVWLPSASISATECYDSTQTQGKCSLAGCLNIHSTCTRSA